MRKLRKTALLALLLTTITPGPATAYFFMQGSYYPVLGSGTGPMGVSYHFGRSFSSYSSYGLGLGWRGRSLSRFPAYPRPSYVQIKALQQKVERLLETKKETYFAVNKPQESVAKIRREESEFREFEKFNTPEIRRLPTDLEKKPAASLISKDGLVVVNYY